MPELLRLKAAIAKASDAGLAAQGYLEASLEVAQKQGAKLWQLRTAIDLAKLLHEQERVQDAIFVLEPVFESINEGDCPNEREVAQELLANLAG